jgi:hypothetical protein
VLDGVHHRLRKSVGFAAEAAPTKTWCPYKLHGASIPVVWMPSAIFSRSDRDQFASGI